MLSVNTKGSRQKVNGSTARLLTGSRVSNNIPQEIKGSMSDRSIKNINNLGTLNDIRNVSQGTGEVLSETGDFLESQAAEGAAALQTVGLGVEIVGFAAAPFTGGATLGLVGIGETMQKTGLAIELGISASNGEVTNSQMINMGSSLLHAKLGTLINKLPNVEYDLTSKSILQLFNSFFNKVPQIVEEVSDDKDPDDQGNN